MGPITLELVPMFHDRQDAGKQLADALAAYKDLPHVLIIGLPRGGVVLAYEVALFLHQPLDVICPRKIGSPSNQELAIGAVTETGQGYFNEPLIHALGVSPEYIARKCEEQQAVAKRRLDLFRKDLPPIAFESKTVIIVDDGLATGATMKAAIQSIKGQHAAKIVAAVPVSPPDTAQEIAAMCDELICLAMPQHFQAVGQFYEVFTQTEDDEVLALLTATRMKN